MSQTPPARRQPGPLATLPAPRQPGPLATLPAPRQPGPLATLPAPPSTADSFRSSRACARWQRWAS
ncbi:hypothetical protein EF294_14140 [Gordonia oryzae]|uniref:Uncharacterized protein n=1 Tax=Gordonia oryzae TaxID=2487349 RepID=A0A3N4H197_9ACTN|nr:hypothetical protein EF294_14140 [Gordonia oryzae]